MADVSVEAELLLNRDQWLAAIRAAQADLANLKAMAAQTEITVPIRLVDQVSPELQQLITRLDGQVIDVRLLAEDRITGQIDAIREEAEAAPIVVPVVAGVGAAGGAGDAGDAAGGAAPGFFSGMMSRRGMGAAFMAFHGLNRVAEEIGLGDESAIDRLTDPEAQLRKRRENIEKEHSGLRGAVNWAYGAIGLQPTYSDEIKELDQAEQEMKRTEARERRTRAIAGNQERLRTGTENADIEAIPSEFKRREAEIDLALKRQLEAADKIADGWKSYGFHTYGEALKAVDHLKQDAEAVAEQERNELDIKRAEYRVRTLQMSLRARGQPSEAEYVGIEAEERIAMRRAQGDPQRQRDILEREAAELDEFIHKQTKPHFFTSEMAFANFLQESAFNDGGAALGEAERRRKKNAKEQGDLKDQGPFAGDAGKAAEDLSGAAENLNEAAQALNQKTIGVIKD